MAKKMHLAARLDSDLIQKIQALTEAQKISVNDLVANALESYERELALPTTVPDRLTGLERIMVSMVESMRDFFPRLAHVQDKTRRIHNTDRIILGWCEHLLASGSDSQQKIKIWEQKKSEIMSALKQEEEAQKNEKTA
jgi:hypothetical protein